MSFYHHGTMRKYTAAILQFFNNMEVQYVRSTGETITKSVPLKYDIREKSRVLDELTSEQILQGNYNVLPRAALTFISLNKSEQRTVNKNLKVNHYKTTDNIQYMYSGVPYEFLYDIVVQCRGMNEATQIVEQIAPQFNPIVNIDIWDASNLDSPSRIPILLQGIAMEDEQYENITSNLVTVTFSLSLVGNLFPPIKTIERIKEFTMNMHEILDDDESTKLEMMEWDVDNDGNIET